MNAVRCLAIALGFLLLGCSSEDARLPAQLYDEAIRLTQQGKNLQARTLMEQLAAKYPDTPTGRQAGKDLYILEALLKRELQDRQQQLRGGLKRVADALTRYKGKRGEYPRYLNELVPEYLEQAPEAPWKHPFLYRPFVSAPILDVKDKRGRLSQVFNTKLDSYHMVCLGVDLQPGGVDLASDTFVVNGEVLKLTTPPPIPLPQPVR